MQGSQGSPKRMTLPPPEWTVPSAEREHSSFGPPPLARRKGGRAEEAALRAQVETARANGDAAAFARAAVHHARWLLGRIAHLYSQGETPHLPL